MVIPDEAVRYILYQRTGCQRFTRTLPRQVLGRPFSIYNQVIWLESKLRGRAIKQLYAEQMEREYLTVKDVLPASCRAVLDIGCGVAGPDIFISRHYGDGVQFYLLDRSRIERKIWYGFRPRGAFYSSLDVAKAMLLANGVHDGSIHLVEAADSFTIKIGCKVDLVISLLSWGFHYPVETYLGSVYDVLAPGGLGILDIRRGTDGIGSLRRKFAKMGMIVETEKYDRVFVTK